MGAVVGGAAAGAGRGGAGRGHGGCDGGGCASCGRAQGRWHVRAGRPARAGARRFLAFGDGSAHPTIDTRPRGPMDKASAHGAGDCRLESYRGQLRQWLQHWWCCLLACAAQKPERQPLPTWLPCGSAPRSHHRPMPCQTRVLSRQVILCWAQPQRPPQPCLPPRQPPPPPPPPPTTPSTTTALP